MVVLLHALASGATEVEGSRAMVKIPEPKAFTSTQSSKELKNFLWDIEHYFMAKKGPRSRASLNDSHVLVRRCKALVANP